MSSEQSADGTIEITARKIGGIDETTVTLSPGVTVLAGRNATNRTSFLQSIMAVMGSEAASLKGDADEGEVELDGHLPRRVAEISEDRAPRIDDHRLPPGLAPVVVLDNETVPKATAETLIPQLEKVISDGS